MPTDKPRFTITVDEDLRKRIEDFRFENRIKNQTQAVIALLELGMKEMLKDIPKEEPAPIEYTEDEQALIDDYRSLSSQGQEYIRQTMFIAKQTYKKMPDVPPVENQA